ncbi:hypothetical protein PoB_004962700 [Plakobranchus ocellatus]|uniref:Apple domain-containing protein n=1 Tax=Plakobranchus ocellatus TaxID=259542 RepID=A0AAV4BUT2_9GAST|nr:hypothetical protein PoB_004962700 [Plakobranchus ocellatus]
MLFYNLCDYCSATTVVIVATLFILRTKSLSSVSTEGWQSLHLIYDRRVDGHHIWVDQTVSNSRQCLRMCWLFCACSAVTFKAEQQRCLLYQLEEDLKAYRTVREPGSLAVDMRKAKMDHTKVTHFKI